MNNSGNTKFQVITNCPVCRSVISDTLFQVKSWETSVRATIQICRSCKTAFTYPPLRSEELKILYNEGLYKNTRNFLHPIVDILQTFFQWERMQKVRRVNKTGKLLDFGCGKGRFMSYAFKKGWDVYGVEPSKTSFNLARHRHGNRVFVSLKQIDIEEKFDVITLWHVLEHIDEPLETLKQIRSYLKPEGRLFIAVPNIESFQARLGKEQWIHLDIPRHRIHYTPDTLKSVLTIAGYQVEWVDHFSLEFNPIGIIQTSLNLFGCEPGLIYKIVKGNFSLTTVLSKRKFLYNLAAIIICIPLLIVPAYIFSCLESLFCKGGTILVCAKLDHAKCSNMSGEITSKFG